MVDELNERIAEILKKQEDLDERLKTIEAGREEFKEMQRTNAKLHQDIKDLKQDIELQYKASTEIQKESFDKMNQVYETVLNFKKEDMSSKREWIIALIGALGGGATIALVFQWLMNL